MGKYTDRISKIKETVKDDAQALKFIENVSTKATDYVRQIERAERIASIHSGSYDFKEKYASADKLRTIKHNALISDITAANRYLFKEYGDQIPVGGLFVGPVEQFHDRDVIGDWAVELVNDIREEQLKREKENRKEGDQEMGASARL